MNKWSNEERQAFVSHTEHRFVSMAMTFASFQWERERGRLSTPKCVFGSLAILSSLFARWANEVVQERNQRRKWSNVIHCRVARKKHHDYRHQANDEVWNLNPSLLHHHHQRASRDKARWRRRQRHRSPSRHRRYPWNHPPIAMLLKCRWISLDLHFWTCLV